MRAIVTEAEREIAAISAIEPPQEEQESYFRQDYAEREWIDAMASIGQTYQRSSYSGPEGGYESMIVRTDCIGPIRRRITKAMMSMIWFLVRPKPVAPLRLSGGADVASERNSEVLSKDEARLMPEFLEGARARGEGIDFFDCPHLPFTDERQERRFWAWMYGYAGDLNA
jgi:hypothetical protein